MPTISATNGRVHAGSSWTNTSAAARARWLTQFATLAVAIIGMAILIGLVMAVALGLGADGVRHVGPDRPPPPMPTLDDSWPNSFAMARAMKEDLPMTSTRQLAAESARIRIRDCGDASRVT